MFGIGVPEILIIALVAIVFLNPKDLPGLFKNVGKSYHKVRRMREDFMKEVNDLQKGFDVMGSSSGPTSPVGTREGKSPGSDETIASDTNDGTEEKQGDVR